MNLRRLKRIALGIGITLIVLPLVVAIAATSGLIYLPDHLIATESTVHSVARVAITGCLLAALGTMD